MVQTESPPLSQTHTEAFPRGQATPLGILPAGRALQVAGRWQMLTSFWLQEQGDLPTCSRKVLRSPRCLWVVALGIKGRLLFMEVSSERWPFGSRVDLRGTGAHELRGP